MTKSKRIIALLLTATMLSGCSGETQTVETTTTTETAQPLTESTTQASATKPELPPKLEIKTLENQKTETTIVVPEEKTDIEYAEYFSNGYILLRTDKKLYMYDIVKDCVTECKKTISGALAVNGVLSMKGAAPMYQWGACETAELINTETGDIIASLETNGIMPYSYGANMTKNIWDKTNNTLVAKKDGNSFSLGLIDGNGEWLKPLSSDYAVCSIPNAATAHMHLAEDDWVFVSDASTDATYIYSFEKDLLIKDSDTGFDDFWGIKNNNIYVYNYSDGCSDLSAYNIDTKEITPVLSGTFSIPPSNSVPETNVVYNNYSQEKIIAVTDNFYNDLGFDLSQQNVFSIRGADKEHIVFTSIDENNNHCINVMNKNGKFICDSISEQTIARADTQTCFVEDKIICYGKNYSDERISYIIDCTTGEVKIGGTDYLYEIIGCYPDAGILLVKSDNLHYIIDLSEPDILINPLE